MILDLKIDPIAPRKSLTTWKKLAAWNSITIEAIDKTLFQPGKSFYLVTIVNLWLCYWHKILIPTRTCHKMKIILWLWPCQSLWELIRSFRWGIWWFPSLYNHRYNSSWIQTVKKWFILLCKFVNMESSKLWHLVIFSIAKIYTSTSTVGLCRSKGLKVTSCQSWRSQENPADQPWPHSNRRPSSNWISEPITKSAILQMVLKSQNVPKNWLWKEKSSKKPLPHTF